MIAITSAKDVNVLREAMHLGVVHYIVKPFTFTTLRERLETYARLKAQLDHLQQADQPEIDRLYQLLRTRNVHESLPKGISAPTLAHVVDFLRDSGEGLSSSELATRANLSQGIARRYLRFLADSGMVNLTPPLRGRRTPGAHLPLGRPGEPRQSLIRADVMTRRQARRQPSARRSRPRCTRATRRLPLCARRDAVDHGGRANAGRRARPATRAARRRARPQA